MLVKKICEFVVSAFFAILASVVLLYISIASGIGPWIAPVIVLAVSPLVYFFTKDQDADSAQVIARIQAPGAYVGLLAVAVGFTLPTYFFVNQANFTDLVTNRPLYVAGCVALFVLLWSVVGTIIGNLFAHHFLQNMSLKIPVADLIKSTINASHEKKELQNLMVGMGFGGVLCAMKAWLLSIQAAAFMRMSFLPQVGVMGSVVAHSISPTLWAVGFIAGPAMAIALFVGLVSKYLVFHPLFEYVCYFRPALELSLEQYLVAVSSGLVVADLVSGGLLGLKEMVSLLRSDNGVSLLVLYAKETLVKAREIARQADYVWFALSCGVAVWFLRWFQITSPALLVFLLVGVCVAVYQMTLLSGQIGLVQFGRFATFVMLPCLFFFKVTAFQAIVISAIVCIVGAAAANLLFQYRLADDLNISRSSMYAIQMASSVLGAACIGVVFVLLCSYLKLGSSEFFAFRCYARALLIQSFNFDLVSVGIGVAWGIVLRLFNVSPAMVLGGILMPRELVVAFVIGAVFSALVENPREHMSTASGVFAAEAIWVFISILIKMLVPGWGFTG